MNEERERSDQESVDDTISNPLQLDQTGVEVPREIAGSPSGSQASRSSSSRREHRIVELLQEVEPNDQSHSEDNWVIGREFYEEDVAADNLDHPMFDDERESVHSEIDRDILDNGSSSDDDNIDNIIDMEFVVAPDEYDTSSDESNADGDARNNMARNYDTTLPPSHQYLGENLEELRGRKILVEGSIHLIHLFNLRDIVLLPGQVLPITTSNLSPRVHSQLKACITNADSTLIGLMSDPSTNSIGTTADIKNFSNLNDELRIIMEGRQRFKLISPPFETAIKGTIRILPELSLGLPYPCPPSWRKLLTHQIEIPYKFIVSKHPRWLVKRYEANSIMRQIMEQIKDWHIGDTQRSANDFSYWIASNLPMSNHERLKALEFNCTEARLLWVLNLLNKCEFFGCSACKNVICHKREVFPMSCSGPQNSFVNSHGFVHDTMTVRSTRGLIQEYQWQSEFTWFPGYSWRQACCENCGRHIGWCYKTTRADTKPKRFFGLSRANVRLQEGGQMPEPMVPPDVVEM